ncbi:MAG: RIP metalloprotease RseP [Candidatus Neomarinimicrobiota bacterium]
MIFIWSTALVIGILVFVHELGHYLAARSVGVRVEKFSIGFPPRFFTITSIDGGFDITFFFFRFKGGSLKWLPIFSTHLGIKGRKGTNTEYVIALIPLGGYVKMAGSLDESFDTELTGSPDEFSSKSVLQKIWILSAGVIMNIITAFVIFTGITFFQGVPEANEGSFIGAFAQNSPAKIAGLEIGDEITSINGIEVYNWSDLVKILRPIPNTGVEIEVLRGDKNFNFSFDTYEIPIPSESGIDTIGGIGISPEYVYLPASFNHSISRGFFNTIRSFGLITLTFKMLASGQATLKDLGGPIMIGQIAGETARAGWIPLFNFMALISINLAFLNILPVPGLDGGHIFIILIETIIRRPLSIKSRMVIQQIGMVLLLGLMFTVMFNDIGRLFN